MEHHSNLVPWQVLREKEGVALKVIPVDDAGNLMVEEMDRLLTDRTKLVSLTCVSNVLGTVNPVEAVIERAHQRDVPVLLDGAQIVQHRPVDVRDLDCDFFAFSGHKIYAETGIGVLCAKKEWLERMPPYRCGGGMISSSSIEATAFLEAPLKFEAGTGHLSGAISLKAAIDYLTGVGLENVMSHEQRVYDYAVAELGDMQGVEVYGNAPQRCGAISFNVEGMHHYDVGAMLDKMGIAVRTGKHCAEPLVNRLGIKGTVRASFGIYNTKAEVDALTDGIRKVRSLL
jgi:cysteine desulfurase/selenocysteine lyase